MNKKSIILGLSMFFLVGCATPNTSGVPGGNNNNGNTGTTTTVVSDDAQNWINSTDAADINDDGKIDAADYELYKAYKVWKLDTSKAKDYNNDHKINLEDYKYYLGYIDYIASEDALDYDGDNKIDETDYDIHVAFNKWLDSDLATDLNGDRKITYEDYQMSLDPEYDIHAWLNSDKAKDYNKDGELDKFDYYCYNFFGTYSIRNYSYSGSDMYIIGTEIDCRNLGQIVNEASITYGDNGHALNLTDVAITKLKGRADGIKQIVSEGVLDVTSATAFNFTVSVTLYGVLTPLRFYFEYDAENKEYDTVIDIAIESKTAHVSFSVYKNEA